MLLMRGGSKKIEGCRYYNHDAIPDLPPHKEPDLKPIYDESLWRMDGRPPLARWTIDWDCKKETQFWYVIKDAPY